MSDQERTRNNRRNSGNQDGYYEIPQDGRNPRYDGNPQGGRNPRYDGYQQGGRDPRYDGYQQGGRDPRYDGYQQGGRDPRYDGYAQGGRDPRYDGYPQDGREPRYGGYAQGGRDPRYGGNPQGGRDPRYDGYPQGSRYTRQEPPKKKKKGGFADVMSILIMIIALGVFIFSGYTLFGFYKEYKKGSDEYAHLNEAYVDTAESETEDLEKLEEAQENGNTVAQNRETALVEENGRMIEVPVMKNPIDFTGLQSENPDVIGWLKLRAVDISYPLVQGEDNDFYLHRTFEKVDNFAGSIFMNADNNPKLTDQNTIIYGHNMKNGSMFGKLKQFSDPKVFKKSKYFWIFTPDLIYQYRIFGAQVVSKVGITYQVAFTDLEYDAYLNSILNNTMVDASNVNISTDDRIVTLSTCTGDDATRFVLTGKLEQIYASKK